MPNDEEINLAKRLIDEFVKEGMEPSEAVLEIAMRTGASSRTVERWVREEVKTITGGYRKLLDELLAKKLSEQKKRG